MEHLDKDTLFMSMACLIGMTSKDPSTKVGAVIVGQDDEVISVGYNGFPRKVGDLDSERYKRPIKYSWIEHAERNAIFNAARIGVSCRGAKIYIPFYPCPDCARGIIQSGIKEVVIDENIAELLIGSLTLNDEKLSVSLEMLKEANVSVRLIQVTIPNLYIMASGKEYSTEEIEEKGYIKSLKRLEELTNNADNSWQFMEEFNLLIDRIEKYEEKICPIDSPTKEQLIEFRKDQMKDKIK